MIGPGLLWFVRFRICREAVTLYLRLDGAERADGDAPVGNGAPEVLTAGAADPEALTGGGAWRSEEPNVKLRLTRKFSMIWPGPRP